MQFLKRLFDFYIYSNIHVAIGAFCFVKITLLYFGITENETALFVFFSSIISYNFIRFMDKPMKGFTFGDWYHKHITQLMVLSIICGILCLYLFTFLQEKALLILFPFLILTLFYGMKLPKKARSLRRIPGLKIFVIAFCFAGITVLFPLVQNDIEISSQEIALFLQRLFFVILITLPFDIRDVDYDSKILKTIPQLFGVRIAKFIGVILMFIMLILSFYFHQELDVNFYIEALMSLFAVILLLFSNANQSRFYSSFWVESLPIFWYVILVFSLKM